MCKLFNTPENTERARQYQATIDDRSFSLHGAHGAPSTKHAEDSIGQYERLQSMTAAKARGDLLRVKPSNWLESVTGERIPSGLFEILSRDQTAHRWMIRNFAGEIFVVDSKDGVSLLA